jgi:hypothetical protein
MRAWQWTLLGFGGAAILVLAAALGADVRIADDSRLPAYAAANAGLLSNIDLDPTLCRRCGAQSGRNINSRVSN